MNEKVDLAKVAAELFDGDTRPRAWAVVQTQPLQERMAAAGLISHRFHAYMPEVAVEQRCGRSLRLVRQPMFRQYLFVSRPADVGWGRIHVPGVMFALGSHGGRADERGPALIAQGDVAKVRAYELAEAEKFQRYKARHGSGATARFADVEPGATIKVVEGAFMGFDGSFERLDAEGRIVVLMRVLGRFHIPAEHAELA